MIEAEIATTQPSSQRERIGRIYCQSVRSCGCPTWLGSVTGCGEVLIRLIGTNDTRERQSALVSHIKITPSLS